MQTSLCIMKHYTLCTQTESGSTARNAFARISTARHFFFKNVNCSTQKVSTARQTKVCRTCTTFRFRADDKKSATARNFEQLTKFL